MHVRRLARKHVMYQSHTSTRSRRLDQGRWRRRSSCDRDMSCLRRQWPPTLHQQTLLWRPRSGTKRWGCVKGLVWHLRCGTVKRGSESGECWRKFGDVHAGACMDVHGELGRWRPRSFVHAGEGVSGPVSNVGCDEAQCVVQLVCVAHNIPGDSILHELLSGQDQVNSGVCLQLLQVRRHIGVMPMKARECRLHALEDLIGGAGMGFVGHLNLVEFGIGRPDGAEVTRAFTVHERGQIHRCVWRMPVARRRCWARSNCDGTWADLARCPFASKAAKLRRIIAARPLQGAPRRCCGHQWGVSFHGWVPLLRGVQWERGSERLYKAQT